MKKLPRITNMQSPQGNPVPNQFIINDGNREIFKSYESVIAVIEKGKVTLDESKWNYSNTTGKYRNIFLGETRKETERKIKDKVYKLKNLNA